MGLDQELQDSGQQAEASAHPFLSPHGGQSQRPQQAARDLHNELLLLELHVRGMLGWQTPEAAAKTPGDYSRGPNRMAEASHAGDALQIVWIDSRWLIIPQDRVAVF